MRRQHFDNLSFGPAARTSNTILVVSSDVIESRFLANGLRENGYKVDTAGDAVDAGLLIMGSCPSLLIVDTYLSDMNGFDFVEVLKSDVLTPYLSVVFLAANENGKWRANELKAVGYFVKPVAMEPLLEVVQSCVTRQSETDV
jgi:DNA-binding response OmpR family regulator